MVTFPGPFIELCVRMVVLEPGYLYGCSGQREGAPLGGENWYPEGATRALLLAHCVALDRLCPTWAHSQDLSLTSFFFSQSQQENICFSYTFLVYLSSDLQLCCCCSVCFNSFEAIAVFLMPKLSGCPCCLYVRSYLASACHEPRKKDKEKL